MRKGNQTTGLESTSDKGRKSSPSMFLAFITHSFKKEKENKNKTKTKSLF